MGPDYRRPQLRVERAWRAPFPHGARSNRLIGWWARFDDAVLTTLQARAEQDSPSLDQAVARIDEARATLAAKRAQNRPSLTGSASYTRESDQVSVGAASPQLAESGLQGGSDASWELDLFGKVRHNAQAAKARVQARIDDWNDARVSLAAEVGDDYVQYRGCEQLAEVLREQSESQEATARLTRISADAGFQASSDAALAEAAAASVRASYTDQLGQCDLLVKSLVSLTSLDEPELRKLLQARSKILPSPPTLDVESVPADLVRQRPDVGSSERELAATSAEIGAAVADLYPSLTLSGSITAVSGLQQWSIGPSLSLPIFDGGQRRANVRSARASYAYQLAAYRKVVRGAILDVEQALVRLDVARRSEGDAERAATGYRATFVATDQLRRAGGASMLDQETARRNALDAQETLISVRVTEIRQWIALYKALGGGWDAHVTQPLARGHLTEEHQP